MHLDAVIHTRVPPLVKKRLEKLAEKSGIPLATYIRLTLAQVARTPFRLKKGRLSA